MRSAKAVVAENPERYNMSQFSSQHTLTSLKRWSILNKELPGEMS